MEYKDLRDAIKDMEDSTLESLKIEFPDGTKISMKKNSINVVGTPFAVMPVENEGTAQVANSVASTAPVIPQKQEIATDCRIVKSPMVGTFYTSSSPDKDAFVKVGDKVKKGDVLCIVEAMKLMNQIESEFDGEIVEICVQNEEMVEYGMPLFKIR